MDGWMDQRGSTWTRGVLVTDWMMNGLGVCSGFFFVGLITLFVYDSEAGLVSWVLVNPV
jgi:hypothetical protein